MKRCAHTNMRTHTQTILDTGAETSRQTDTHTHMGVNVTVIMRTTITARPEILDGTHSAQVLGYKCCVHPCLAVVTDVCSLSLSTHTHTHTQRYILVVWTKSTLCEQWTPPPVTYHSLTVDLPLQRYFLVFFFHVYPHSFAFVCTHTHLMLMRLFVSSVSGTHTHTHTHIELVNKPECTVHTTQVHAHVYKTYTVM